MRMLLRDIPCCGRCWCEDVAARYRDVAARYRATDGADGAGVRMLLRDTVLRTVRTVHAGVRMLLRDTVLRTVLVRGWCCAIPCSGRCGCCCAIKGSRFWTP